MKILDSTVLIAFLREMDYPEGLRTLSSAHKLLVPKAVVGEVRKPPASTRMMDLITQGILCPRDVSAERVQALRNGFLDLGQGECECVALWETVEERKSTKIVTDDKRIRKRLPGFPYVWTQELLDYMVRRRLIDGQAAKGLLGRLAASSFYQPRSGYEFPTGYRESLKRQW